MQTLSTPIQFSCAGLLRCTLLIKIHQFPLETPCHYRPARSFTRSTHPIASTVATNQRIFILFSAPVSLTPALVKRLVCSLPVVRNQRPNSGFNPPVPRSGTEQQVDEWEKKTSPLATSTLLERVTEHKSDIFAMISGGTCALEAVASWMKVNSI